MNPTHAAVKVVAARWEQWIGASLRAEHFRSLTAASRATRRRRAQQQNRRRARPGLQWLQPVSIAGYWLPR